MLLCRGWFGEKRTALSLWLWLDKKTYRRYHNLIIPSSNGTAQIDHLIVSPFGLFIVETKNMKGWIFGSEQQPKWTQVIYNSKYTFQNPLRQTWRQKCVLSEFLGYPLAAIETIVYFNGDVRFKTAMPANVICSRPAQYIRHFQEQRLSTDAIQHICKILNDHVSNSRLSKSDHLRSLRERHSSETICPRCGAELVLRVARKGPFVGSSFLGCRNYPSCRYTKRII